MHHRIQLPLLLSFVLLASLAPAASSQDRFRGKQHPGPAECTDVCTADFDGDGLADVATADGTLDRFTVLFGHGTQGFAPYSASNSYSSIGGGTVEGITCADFDGDTIPDIAISVAGADVIEIWLNNGSGAFNFSWSEGVGSNPTRIVAGQLDAQDSFVDLAVLCGASNEVWTLRGDGAGAIQVFGANSFQPFVAGSPSLEDLTLGDLDGDGLLECAVPDSANDRVWVANNDGFGGLVHLQTLSIAPTGEPQTVGFADANNDGNQDLFIVVANSIPTRVELWLGDGSGQLVYQAFHDDGAFQNCRRLVLRDYDGDGRIDLGAAMDDVWGNEIRIKRQLPDGSFGLAFTSDDQFLAGGSGVRAFAVADFDGDGKEDIASPSHSGSAGVTLLRGLGSGLFDSPHLLDGGGIVSALAFVDLDGNGTCDAVTADPIVKRIGWNSTDGAFGQTSWQVEGVAGQPVAIAIGDFDADGRPDAVAAQDDNADVALLLNDGFGTLLPATYFRAGSFPKALTVADVNLDGNPDVLVAAEGSNQVTILLGNGAGSLAPGTTIPVSSFPRGIAAGDLDFDGTIDVVTANNASGDMAVALGTGTGAFGAATYFSVGSGAFSAPQGVALADVNGDFVLDIAISGAGDDTVTVRNGLGNGSFGPSQVISVGEQPTDVVLADLSGDGRADLAVAQHGIGSGNLGVLDNDGTGVFGARSEHAIVQAQAFQQFDLAAADLDSDGAMDLGVASGLFLTMFRNQTAMPAGLSIGSTGTHGCLGRLGLSASAPVQVNTTIALTATNAPPRSLGLGLATDVADFGGSDPFGIFVTLHVDLIQSTDVNVIDFFSDTVGGAFAPVAVPNNPLLVGKTYYLQTLWVATASGPCKPSFYGLETSRLLTIVIQP